MKKIKRGKKKGPRLNAFQVMCLMHFEELRDFNPEDLDRVVEGLSCFRCEDFKHGTCLGEFRFGDSCLDCMEQKVAEGMFEDSHGSMN